MGSYPKCTVTVYNTGTNTLATLYSNSTGTPLSNPFTAQVDALWNFFAVSGSGYDVVLSGGSPIQFPSPVTIPDLTTGVSGGSYFIQSNPTTSQTITQPINTLFNFIVSGTGNVNINGSPILTANSMQIGDTTYVSPNGGGDIAAPLNAAITACTAPHCQFFINAAGNVNVNSPIVVDRPNVTISCASPKTTTLMEQAYPVTSNTSISVTSNIATVNTNTQNYVPGHLVYVVSSNLGTIGPAFVVSATPTSFTFSYVHANVSLTADSGTSQQIGGILYAEADNFELHHCGFDVGVNVQNSGVGVGVYSNGTQTANYSKIHDNVFTDRGLSTDGIVLLREVGATTTYTASNGHFWNNIVNGPWIDIAVATDANDTEIGPNNYLYGGEYFDLNGDYGASFSSVDGTTVHDNWMQNGTGGAYVQDATHTILAHNHFINFSIYPIVQNASVSILSNVLTVNTALEVWPLGAQVHINSSVLGQVSGYITSATLNSFTIAYTHANLGTTLDTGTSQAQGQSAVYWVQPFYQVFTGNQSIGNIYVGSADSGACITEGQEEVGLVVDGDNCSYAGLDGIVMAPWNGGAPGPSGAIVRNVTLHDNGQSAPNSGLYCGIHFYSIPGQNGMVGANITNSFANDDATTAALTAQAYSICESGGGNPPQAVITFDNVFYTSAYSTASGTGNAFYLQDGCVSCSVTQVINTAGAGAGYTTGPITSVSGDTVCFTGTFGQVADCGYAPATIYTAAGVAMKGHSLYGQVSLVGGTVTVTFVGGAAYTTGYSCTANDGSGVTAAVGITQVSASQVTFYGTGTDLVLFQCVGS